MKIISYRKLSFLKIINLFIAEFLGALKGHDSKIIAIISYIEKDPSYFEKAFETIIEPQKIQKKSCINKIKDYLTQK